MKRISKLLMLLGLSLTVLSCAAPQHQVQVEDSVPASDRWSTERTLLPGVTFSFLNVNGITMRVAEMGEGPAVLMAHGWPESWYSWRHQMQALAAAGYRAIAPDMRGYGETEAPQTVTDYDVVHLTADMVGVLDALKIDQAHMVGHDWGAIVAANCAVYYPERFLSLTLMSVPHGLPAPVSPLAAMRARSGDNFFYIVYHNEADGVAEAEYDADPYGLLSRLYLSPDSPREAPEVNDPKRVAGGWIPRLGAANGLPGWLDQADLDYVVGQFSKAGFRGGVNYYRNFERNRQINSERTDNRIHVPTMSIAGEKDVVIGGASVDALRKRMAASVVDLKGVELIPEVGHWVQQEAPEQTNVLLLNFLSANGQP